MRDKNPLFRLKEEFGQSIWLDSLHRSLFSSGELQQLIEEKKLQGTIIHSDHLTEAIADSDIYDEAIRSLFQEGKRIDEIYRLLIEADGQWAAELFWPIYEQTLGQDGFVSLEISAPAAYNTEGIIAEARRLWAAINRPNIMIKLPATLAALPAIEHLISEGVNVNATLIFSLSRYRRVIEAYLAGLEIRAEAGLPLGQIGSVAGFSLSRIDLLLDPRLEKRIESEGMEAKLAEKVQGEVAIAMAKVAYQIYQKFFTSEQFHRLTALGAYPQRLLWTSTMTEDPKYGDIRYIEALIGPETVNSIPLETLKLYQRQGQPALRLTRDVQKAYQILDHLTQLNINMKEVADQLEAQGLHKFAVPYAGEKSIKADKKLQRLSADLSE